MKKSITIFFAILLLLFLCSCSNPWMTSVLEYKTVSFNANGGSPTPSDQRLPKNKKVTAPKEPAKNGELFAGWYTDYGTFADAWDFNTIPGENMTLYARWIPAGPGSVTLITNAALTITAPTTGWNPGTPTISGPANFSIYNTSWTPNDNPFGSGVVYTVTITLTANTGFIFANPGFNAVINGYNASINIITGNEVIIHYTFSTTAPYASLNTISGIAAFLNSQTGGGTVNDPINLQVDLDLGDMTNSASVWHELLNVLYNSGKFVNLDLSQCSMTGTEFDPDNNTSIGKDMIISITLPNTAVSMANGTSAYQTFYHFQNLRNVYGLNIGEISEYVFRNCDALETVSFPWVTHIYTEAFFGCSALNYVYIPAITSIDSMAFQATGTGPITISMGGSAPTLGKIIFDGSISKAVSVIIPLGATGFEFAADPYLYIIPYTISGSNNDELWGNGLRGAGWDGTHFIDSGAINNLILFTMEYL